MKKCDNQDFIDLVHFIVSCSEEELKKVEKFLDELDLELKDPQLSLF